MAVRTLEASCERPCVRRPWSKRRWPALCAVGVLVTGAGCTDSPPRPTKSPETRRPHALSPVASVASPTQPDNRLSFAELYPTGMGMVVIGSSRLFRTLDSGTTWREITPPVVHEPEESGAEVLGIYRAIFIDARRGWVIRSATPGDSGTLALQRTVDGGRTWPVVALVDHCRRRVALTGGRQCDRG